MKDLIAEEGKPVRIPTREELRRTVDDALIGQSGWFNMSNLYLDNERLLWLLPNTEIIDSSIPPALDDIFFMKTKKGIALTVDRYQFRTLMDIKSRPHMRKAFREDMIPVIDVGIRQPKRMTPYP